MTSIKIGGVPEHFNLPWHLAQKDNAFYKQNIDLQWRDYPGGTGAMCQALRKGDIDIAIILTEGIVKDIIDGNPSKIIQTYVQTPLVWGIHVKADTSFKTINDLKGSTAAISRRGSGSHLMAYINAKQNYWDISKDLNFKVIQDLEGALKGFSERSVDYLLWEKFMTKPYVDKGILRHLGNCLTPWPCFVIAARNKIIQNNPKLLKQLLETINTYTQNFKTIEHIENLISERYNLHVDDVKSWLEITEWSQSNINESTILNVQKHLSEVKMIPNTLEYQSLTHELY